MKRMHLRCAAHNKSCFIKAKSHPLSVYNHRSRLNRGGNTIPFRFRVILIYELVSATLVRGYELGKLPQHCNIAPAHSQDRPVHTKQLVSQYINITPSSGRVMSTSPVIIATLWIASSNLQHKPSQNGGSS